VADVKPETPVLFLRIKQAEVALADRRLDEAYEIAKASELRKHRSGQELVGRLARAYLERGREHLDADRPIPACHDCEKAEQLAGNLPEVADLRAAVAAALKAGHEAQQRCAQVLAAARRQFERGQLTIGQNILSRNHNHNNEAVMLADMAENQRAVIDALMARANEALKRDDWQAAIDIVGRSTPSVCGDMHVRELVNQIVERVLPKLSEALDHGRLDIAQSLVSRIERVAPESMEIEQVRQTLRQCGAIWTAIDHGKLREAEEMVRRLTAVLPDAKWLATVGGNLKRAAESLEELRTGPFSLLSEQMTIMVGDRAARPAHSPVAQPPRLPMDDQLAENFTIRVDGVGSFRVLRGKRITIGPLSGSKRVDLAVLAEAMLPTVAIERDEEDYFLRSQVPVAINDQPTTGRLLNNGDRIMLSSRCRMTFARPSPASNSALLHLSGARLPKADVRSVILLDRELIIGPGPNAHIRCDEMTDSAILHARDGKLFCQSPLGVLLDGVAAAPSAPLPMNAQIAVGPVSFSIGKD
jgi:hypothetical protein